MSGDFNIDLLKYDTNGKYADFLNAITSFGYLPTILHPTRITEFSSTIIDNIFTNNLTQKSKSGNILIMFADHFSQFVTINKAIKKNNPPTTFYRDYSNFNKNSFIDDVSIQNWNSPNFTNTNEKFNDFLWRLEGCVDRHAPLKKLNKKQLSNRSKPWINDNILKLMRHRDKLLCKKKKNPTDINIKHAYNIFRNRTTREIRKAKKIY